MAPRKQYALVTGCGEGGIGEALVTQYVQQGLHPIATILPSESHEHLSAKGISWFHLDVTDDHSVLELQRRVDMITGGYLDVLVDNAGICYTMTAIDSDINEIKRMFDVNVFGPMRMVRHFHSLLIAARGTIVNIGSVGGIVPFVYGSSYNATKAALQHWSNTLRVEMKPLGVRVITVISGEIGTNILKRDQQANRELPEGSYYSPLATEFAAHIHRIPNTTDRFVYAKRVVAESLRESPTAWLWTGSSSSLVRFFDIFGFRTFWDYVFWRWFGLGKLKDAHQQRKPATD